MFCVPADALHRPHHVSWCLQIRGKTFGSISINWSLLIYHFIIKVSSHIILNEQNFDRFGMNGLNRFFIVYLSSNVMPRSRPVSLGHVRPTGSVCFRACTKCNTLDSKLYLFEHCGHVQVWSNSYHYYFVNIPQICGKNL